MLQLRAQLQLFNFPSQLIKDCYLIVHGGGGAEVHAVLTLALDRGKWSALRPRPPYPWGKTSLRPLEKEQGQHHDQFGLCEDEKYLRHWEESNLVCLPTPVWN